MSIIDSCYISSDVHLEMCKWLFNPFSAGIDFRLQKLLSMDVSQMKWIGLKATFVHIWTSVNPRVVRVKIFLMAVDLYKIGIQIERKELLN